MYLKGLLLLLLFPLLLAGGWGCSSHKDADDTAKRALNRSWAVVDRTHEDTSSALAAPQHHSRASYPWEHRIVGNYPKITREYFRCKGSSLHEEQTEYADCDGTEEHSLPIHEGREFVYPILIELLNYVQAQTGKQVIITSGHRCPKHNTYVDPSKENLTSKHMIGAQVSFYVQGLEEDPERVISLLMEYYSNADTEGEVEDPRLTEFDRYSKQAIGTSTQPWYNREVFIKLFDKTEGRDLDNRHPYPYISVQVRWDRASDQQVSYTWPKAHRGYHRRLMY